MDIHLPPSPVVFHTLFNPGDPRVINVSFQFGDQIQLHVWDLPANREIATYQVKEGYGDVNLYKGQNSSYGYLLGFNRVINLERGIPDHFFTRGEPHIAYEDYNGRKINSKEDAMIINGNVITKSTYMRLHYMERLKEDRKEPLDLQKIFYNREGSNICHDFALDPERLAIALELIEEKGCDYFSMLLLEDKNGNTPLDIVLDNRSPKCLELILDKLAKVTGVACTRVFQDRLEELFEMDIQAFHTYLESCFF